MVLLAVIVFVYRLDDKQPTAVRFNFSVLSCLLEESND